VTVVTRPDVETKLGAARTRLILDKPFLGALVLRLPLEAAGDWCRTTAVDARKLYYNAEYIDRLNLAETQFMLAHEALHCALGHFARRGHRVKHLWDIACDYAINPILINDGLTPPPGTLYERIYEGMSAEEIYPFIQDNENESTLDQHVYDRPEEQSRGKGRQPPPDSGEGKGGNRNEDEEQDRGQGRNESDRPETETDENQGGSQPPPPLSHQEREELAVQWRQRLAGAAQQAMQSGKLSGDMARLVDHLLQPQLPWRMLLARYMSAQARDDYSYNRPSSRRGEPAILPSLRSHNLDVVVVLDTSGSVSDQEMNDFITEVDAIKGQIRARVSLHSCDHTLNPDGPWVFEPWEALRLPESFKGGGGTDFRPVFDWIDTLDRQPDLLVYFTDAQGEFPALAPHFPVVWLVKGKSPVPWGQRVQLN
jgi:predicted metal-dependent peptidase